jgi:hypothetical protein
MKKVNYYMSKRTLAEKVKAAKFTETQKLCLMECLSKAHGCGVRYGSDPSCKENLAFVIKQMGGLDLWR